MFLVPKPKPFYNSNLLQYLTQIIIALKPSFDVHSNTFLPSCRTLQRETDVVVVVVTYCCCRPNYTCSRADILPARPGTTPKKIGPVRPVSFLRPAAIKSRPARNILRVHFQVNAFEMAPQAKMLRMMCYFTEETLSNTAICKMPVSS